MRNVKLLLLLLISIPITANAFTVPEKFYSDDVSPILLRESPYSFDKTVNNLKKAISGRNFRVLKIQKVDHGFVDEDKESNDMVIYFCNFSLVSVAIKVDTRVGQFLPCRITIIERDGKVYLMTMNPRTIADLLDNPEMKKICERVTNMYFDILDEVTI